MADVSVLICSRTPAKAERATKMYEAMGCEVVVMFDMPNLAAGYNLGLKKATGDTIVYSHDDVEVVDISAGTFYYYADSGMVAGVAGTSKLVGPGWAMAGPNFTHGKVAHLYNNGYGVAIYGDDTLGRHDPKIHAMDGLLLICPRYIAEALPWDESFGWHCADIDWTYRAHLAGHSLKVTDELHVIHASPGDYTSDAWAKDAVRFMAKWGDKLPPNPNRKFQFACVETADRDEAIRVLRGE